MFIVLTRMFFEPDVKDQVMEIARLSTPIAKAQPGLVSFTQHVSSDGGHLMTYWAWRSEADHLACMASVDWAGLNPRWEVLQGAGKMRFEIGTYSVLEA